MTKQDYDQILRLLQDDISIEKRLFNSENKDQQEINDFIPVFSSLIQASNNGPIYYIKLVDFFVKCRPCQCHVASSLATAIFTCFPSSKEEISHYIITHLDFLKFILFPKEY